MIFGMIIWEVIFILIYLFYQQLGQGRVTASFIEKILLFLSEIIPCLFICLAVFYMKVDRKTHSDDLDLQENLGQDEFDPWRTDI